MIPSEMRYRNIVIFTENVMSEILHVQRVHDRPRLLRSLFRRTVHLMKHAVIYLGARSDIGWPGLLKPAPDREINRYRGGTPEAAPRGIVRPPEKSDREEKVRKGVMAMVSMGAALAGLALSVLAAEQTTIVNTKDFHKDKALWTSPAY